LFTTAGKSKSYKELLITAIKSFVLDPYQETILLHILPADSSRATMERLTLELKRIAKELVRDGLLHDYDSLLIIRRANRYYIRYMPKNFYIERLPYLARYEVQEFLQGRANSRKQYADLVANGKVNPYHVKRRVNGIAVKPKQNVNRSTEGKHQD
jgi:hypothetical protein